MMEIDKLKCKLNWLFDSLESEEVLSTLKSEFIESLFNNYEFIESYSESKKIEYFISLELYISRIIECIEIQKSISNLELDELRNICDYYKLDNILNVFSWCVEYIKSSYIDIDIINKNIIIRDIPDDVVNDLEKIDEFLNGVNTTI